MTGLLLKPSIVYICVSTILLNVSPCNCSKDKCNGNVYNETRGIYFGLKDKLTGNDILTSSSQPIPAPDSIKLKDQKTGFIYPLFIGRGGVGVNNTTTVLYSQSYRKPGNITDSLVFYYGNAVPDTLIIQTGTVTSWRGDECASIQDVGITKVFLRNQMILDTHDEMMVFTLRK